MRFDELEDVAVDVAELLVATARMADAALEPAVLEVLRLLRDKMKVDAVFVRATRPADPGSHDALAGPKEPEPLEAAWGEQMLCERLQPTDLATGQHQNYPVYLANGNVYGTLCGFSRGEWTAQMDLKILKSSAVLIAQKINQSLGAAPGPRSSRFFLHTTPDATGPLHMSSAPRLC